MTLDEIGFYTLNDDRVRQLSATSPMWRCELIITDRCNFNCLYCRGLKPELQGDMDVYKALSIIDMWCHNKPLKNIRFSGGEPTLHPDLWAMVAYAKQSGIERIAISTNGTADPDVYTSLVNVGANDFSISLDACCSADGAMMAGVANPQWERINSNIEMLSNITYVSVGIVLTPENIQNIDLIVAHAHTLGVDDIRIIPSAQWDNELSIHAIKEELLVEHPILRYRINNIKNGRHVRGIQSNDALRCYLPIDDSAIAGDYHFPCIIYMREQGKPIGEVGPNMRAERIHWSQFHLPAFDPICKKNCLDVCIDYNKRCEMLNPTGGIPR